MYIYEIYQVKDEFLREYGYLGLEGLRRERRIAAEGTPELPREVWEKVYRYETEKEPSLDWLFTKFNRGDGMEYLIDRKENMKAPEDFHGRSLSVSDIIKTPDGRLWFCDSWGWQEVKWAK